MISDGVIPNPKLLLQSLHPKSLNKIGLVRPESKI